MSTPDTPSLKLLLLHRLPESEAQQLEERLMVEEHLADLLREAEHDLLDDYASGRLVPEERAAVEKYLLVTAADRERLKVARALARLQAAPERARSRSPFTRRWWPPGWPVRLGVAIAACAILSLGVLVFRMKPTGGLPAPTTTVVLLADAQRGSSGGSINISATAARVRLQVEIPAKGSASTYTLAIADRGGRVLYEAPDLPPRLAGPYPFVEAIVPATALDSPRCRITLTESTSNPASPRRAFAWDLEVQRR
jgi:anti-sigma factor RsiW